VLPPAQVLGRVDAFVRAFDAELPRTSSAQLANVVQSLARAKREKARRLAQQAGRYWLEVARGEYLFSRGEEEACAIERVRLDDVVALFRQRMLPGGPAVRRASVLVEPKAGKAAAVSDALLPGEADPLALRALLQLFPRPRRDEDLDSAEGQVA
jgi:secreted Zn-dependent insulinase-like peptidase